MCAAGLLAMLLGVAAAAQEPTCRLEGQVVDPSQRPVANADVLAMLDGEVLVRTHSDGSGMFVFGRLPYRQIVVQARAAGPDIGVAWLDLLGLPRQFARITTMPARRVAGVVRDDADRPVGGAFVVSIPQWPDGTCDPTTLAGAIVQADDGGEYTLTHVPFGHVLLRAWAPEHEVGEDAVDGSETVTMPLQVRRRARQQRVFALDGAGAGPLAAAQLEVAATSAGYPVPLPPPLRRPARRDDEWHLCGWPVADALTARVALAGVDFAPRRHFVAADQSGGVRRFAVATDDGRSRVRGRLTGSAARAGLWLVVAPRIPQAGQERALGQTQDDGTFDLPAPVDLGETFQLRVLDADVTTVRQEPLATRCWWQASLDTSGRYEVPVAAARQIRLRAVDARGTPVPGVAVTLASVPSARTIAGAGWGVDAPPPLSTGTTGIDGTLTLGGLDFDDDEALTVRLRSAAGWAEVLLRPGRATATTVGDLTLQPGATLSLTVRTAAGSPVPGAVVTVTQPPDNLCLHVGRDGRLLQTGLPPETCLVHGPSTELTVVPLVEQEVSEVEVVRDGDR